MKHFKEFIQWCCEPQRLFVLFIVVLAIPNVALFFTEQQMTLWARICNVILAGIGLLVDYDIGA